MTQSDANETHCSMDRENAKKTWLLDMRFSVRQVDESVQELSTFGQGLLFIFLVKGEKK